MLRFNIAKNLLSRLAQSIDITPTRCRKLCHKSSTCNLCESNCNAGAIAIDTANKNISIDSAKCTNCGMCINLCPVEVYSFKEGRALIDSIINSINNGVLEIACQSDIIACIGSLGLPDILHLYINGAKEIRISMQDCANCVNRYGREVLEDELNTLHNLSSAFEQLHGTEIISSANEILIKFPKLFHKLSEAHIKDSSRRALFNTIAKGTVGNITRGVANIVPQLDSGNTPKLDKKYIPAKRLLFIQSITQCGKLLEDKIDSDGYFFTVTISKKCNLCKICTRFCPTGALHATNDGQALAHTPAICVSCGMCLVSCYMKYIKRADTVDLRTFFDENILHVATD